MRRMVQAMTFFWFFGMRYATAHAQDPGRAPDWISEFKRVAVPIAGQDNHARLLELFAIQERMDEASDSPTTRWIGGQEVKWYSWTSSDAERDRQVMAARLAAVRSFDLLGLDASDRLNLAVLASIARHADELAQFPSHLMPIAWQIGPQRDLSSIRELPTRTPADFETILAYLRGVPASIDEAITLMRLGLAARVTPPRSTLGDEARVIHRLATESAGDSPLLAAFRQMPAAIPETVQVKLRRTAADLFERVVRLSYRRLDQFFQSEYLPNAVTSLSMLALPEGRAWYAATYHAKFSIDITPEAVEQLGRTELARVQAAFDSAQGVMGFPGSRAELFRHLMMAPGLRVRDSADLMVRVSTIAKQIDGALFRVVDTLPQLIPYGVTFVDRERAATFSSAQASPGSWRAHRAPTMLLNPTKLDALPIWKLENLVLHEAYPGHLLQFGWNQQLGKVPSFRPPSIPAFVEGWAMYAETLGAEVGLYRDSLARLGLLAGKLDRALRLVVETGIHLRGWSRDQARAFLHENGMEPDDVNELAIDRFIARPGLLSAHLVGFQSFWRLRGEAEARLGPHLDLAALHVAMLQAGTLPLPVLEEQVRQWIAREELRKPRN